MSVNPFGILGSLEPGPLGRQEKDREVEMRGVTAALDKAREQISDATWREGLALEKVH